MTSRATQTVIDRHDQFMINNCPRYPVTMVRGQGCELWDADGKRYLDLFAGFGAGVLGHCHPDLVEAVNKQAQTLWHVGNLLHTEPQTQLAQAIARHGFGGQSYFCHSGADANEAAIKLARLYGRAHPHPATAKPRYKIITAQRSFHGRTLATMAATGQAKAREGFEPIPEGFVHVPFNDAEAVEHAIDDETAAIMVEPIQGEGGVNVPDDAYLADLRTLANDHRLLLIFDEVWTGCGRTGRYFAHQHWGVEPDVMTLAKGVGGGLAVGVMCAKPFAAEYFDVKKAGVKHATTLGGNCLSMAVSAAIFQVLERDNLVDKAVELGDYVRDKVRSLAQKHPFIKGVRGRGLFLGIEVAPSESTWFDKVGPIVERCLNRQPEGLLINGTQDTVLRLAPPLTVTREQLDEGLTMLEEVLVGEKK